MLIFLARSAPRAVLAQLLALAYTARPQFHFKHRSMLYHLLRLLSPAFRNVLGFLAGNGTYRSGQ